MPSLAPASRDPLHLPSTVDRALVDAVCAPDPDPSDARVALFHAVTRFVDVLQRQGGRASEIVRAFEDACLALHADTPAADRDAVQARVAEARGHLVQLLGYRPRAAE